MEEVKQKYSTTTVLIVIAFLAIPIIMPPLARIFYKEEPSEIVSNDNIDEQTNIGTLICTIEYPNTALSIESTAIYDENGEIVTNTLVFTNPNNITSDESLEDTGKTEYLQYNTLLTGFSGLDAEHLIVDGTTTTVTIDNDIYTANDTNQSITNNYQDEVTLQNHYEIDGFTCTTQ